MKITHESEYNQALRRIVGLIDENANLKQELFYWKRLAQEAVDALQRIEQEILESDI